MADQIKREPPRRSFTIVYNDFIDSESILSSNEKLIYLILLRYGDNVFPSLSTLSRKSGLSKRTVQRTIDSLIEKKFISKRGRKNEKTGGYTSNIYFVYDNAKLWQKKADENEEVIKDYGEDKLFNEIKSRPALLARIKKELISSTDQSNDISPKVFSNHVENHYNTKDHETQAIERWTLDDIKQHYSYDILLEQKSKDDADGFMNLLYDLLNTTKDYISISGERKPTAVVWGRLEKMYYAHVVYAIDQFNAQTKRIHNQKAYKTKLLYEAYDQLNSDIQNRFMNDFYGNNEDQD